jgi:hypothetical protein
MNSYSVAYHGGWLTCYVRSSSTTTTESNDSLISERTRLTSWLKGNKTRRASWWFEIQRSGNFLDFICGGSDGGRKRVFRTAKL